MSLMEEYSHIFEKKSRLRLVLLSMAVCGIEFCYSAETAFVTPTLLHIGVPTVYMTLIWCIGPALGFLLVPIVGSVSDRCPSGLGRRRPFILMWSVGIIFGLLLVPYGEVLGYKVTGEQMITAVNATALQVDEVTTVPMTVRPNVWSIVFTGIGAVLLDCCDACQTPSRAYLIEVTTPDDHPRGLSTFTIMAGIGGSIGYVIGGIDWNSNPIGQRMGGHVRVVFTAVLVMFIFCVSLTITAAKEVPLHQLGPLQQEIREKELAEDREGVEKGQDTTEDEGQSFNGKATTTAPDYGSGGQTDSALLSNDNDGEKSDTSDQKRILDNETTQAKEERAAEISKSKSLLPNSKKSKRKTNNALLPSEITLGMYLSSIVHMPKSLVILCLVNLLCWMSLMCYSLYFTDFVGEAVYGGDPTALQGTESYDRFARGVRMGSFAMALYSITCSVYSFAMETLIRRFGAKRVYMLSPLVYTVGAILMATIRHPVAVIVLSICPGVIYATLLTMPYLLVANYHNMNQFEEISPDDPIPKGPKQVRGLGTDLGLVSSMVFIAQVILSVCIGSIVQALDSTIVYMVSAAVLSLCGAIAASQVVYLDM